MSAQLDLERVAEGGGPAATSVAALSATKRTEA
jgi:hypothetical protein